MPAIIDTQALNVNDLPTVWSPVQWEQTADERETELEDQHTASLLWAADAPEAILRLLLGETDIARAIEPPDGFDPEQQGDWDPDIDTYVFRRPIRLVHCERAEDGLFIEYKFGELGHWTFEISEDEVKIRHI